eukprot:4642707-Amphidinium_carterae.1
MRQAHEIDIHVSAVTLRFLKGKPRAELISILCDGLWTNRLKRAAGVQPDGKLYGRHTELASGSCSVRYKLSVSCAGSIPAKMSDVELLTPSAHAPIPLYCPTHP